MPKIDKFWHRGYPFHWAKCYSWNYSCYFEKRKIQVIGFISNQTITIWLASLLSSLFIYVKVYCWYPLPKWLNFAPFLKRFAVNRVTSLRLVVQKKKKKKKKKKLIHCSKIFTHTNIIKAKKFYTGITFAFWKCEGNKVLRFWSLWVYLCVILVLLRTLIVFMWVVSGASCPTPFISSPERVTTIISTPVVPSFALHASR